MIGTVKIKELPMTISMYAASVPVFKKTLVALSAILAKTDAHVTAKKIEPTALL